MIQEQNVIAGITNKILSRFVDVVAVGYKDAEASFSKAKRVVYTGNPVRPDVLVDTRADGRNYFNLSDDTFTVLIAGGSRGARTINNAMIDVHKHFQGTKGIKLIHITGDGEYKSVLSQLGITDGDGLGDSSVILPYLHDMPKALAAADLAVFRSGAIGLAELAVRGIPSVLVPYPYAAHMIVDQMLSAHDLIGEIEMFMANRDLLSQMGERALQLGKPNAAHDIAKLALSIAK